MAGTHHQKRMADFNRQEECLTSTEQQTHKPIEKDIRQNTLGRFWVFHTPVSPSNPDTGPTPSAVDFKPWEMDPGSDRFPWLRPSAS